MTKEDAVSNLEMYRANNSNYDEETAEAIDIILSMLEEKDKVIDFMVEEIDKSMGNTCPLADYNYNLNCEKECNDDYKKCWKNYFENKAKEYLKER